MTRNAVTTSADADREVDFRGPPDGGHDVGEHGLVRVPAPGALEHDGAFPSPTLLRDYCPKLQEVLEYADDVATLTRLWQIKQHNKERLAMVIGERAGTYVTPNSMFIAQVKRIHEYKRQLLNCLHIIALYRALSAAADAWDTGARDAGILLGEARSVLRTVPDVQVQYLELVDPDTLEPVETAGTGSVIAIAAFVGRTRLIDNIVLG